MAPPRRTARSQFHPKFLRSPPEPKPNRLHSRNACDRVCAQSGWCPKALVQQQEERESERSNESLPSSSSQSPSPPQPRGEEEAQRRRDGTHHRGSGRSNVRN